MKRFPAKPRPEAGGIEARAAAWLVERDAGFSGGAARAFARWCAADPRHSAAVHRLEQTWDALQQLREYRPTARAYPDPDLLCPSRQSGWARSVRAAMALAAALTLAATGWWATDSLHKKDRSEQSYATTSGGYQRVALSDGSVVELNSNTDLRVHYRRAERRVELLRGEAHFTVAKDPGRPFWVAVDGVTVRAVGTAFDVRVAPRGIEVLVTAGTVQVDLTPVSHPGEAAGPTLLHAGWRAVVPLPANEAPSLEKIASPVARDLLAWQGSRLVFVEMPLGEVIEQFNLRNQVQLTVADPELAKIPVGGSFAADNVETFVRLLSSNGDLTSERVGPYQIVLRRVQG